jgi:hypothetical protein
MEKALQAGEQAWREIWLATNACRLMRGQGQGRIGSITLHLTPEQPKEPLEPALHCGGITDELAN